MSGGRIAVLRLGHRKGRDPRITTHLGLVARAFGADEFYLAGDEDVEMFATLAAVGERFGSPLKLEHVKSPMGFLKRWIRDSGSGVEGLATHLTMYGERFRDAIPQMPRDRDLLVVVGGSKVPAEVFEHCQFNIAIGNQPHSEVAALALFLDEWGGNLDMAEKFKEGRLEIIPSKQGKVVIDHDEES
jgi:tRNA (cytidine56-2'-O)-methyltransferase